MKTRPTLRRRCAKAFTLVEVMVAGGISVVFLGAAAVFTVFVYEQMFAATEETRFNATARQLQARMLEDIRESSWFSVYRSFALADRDTAADRILIGNGGNALVLFYTNSALTTEPSHEVLTKIVGYYADTTTVTPGGAVSLKRFEITPATGITWYYNPNINPANYVPPGLVTPNPSIVRLEDYFAGVTGTTVGTRSVVFLENPPSSRPLFYNQNTHVTVVAGTLFGNTGNNMRQTFNFSATPQG